MSHPSGDERTDARCLIEASAWRVHLSEKGLESTHEFDAWLSCGDNRQAWNRVQQSWGLLDAHATSPELLDLRRRALGKARSIGRQRWAARHRWTSRLHRAAVAAGVLMLVAGGAIAFRMLGADIYRTATGERRVVTLADGSQVQLDSLTELHVDYSANVRELKLIKGQASFDVAHDVQRPFSVAAAGRKVIATGTAFNVDLLDRNLYVTLIEGKVFIVPLASPPVASAPSSRRSSMSAPPLHIVELKAGQQFAMSESGATSVKRVNVQQAKAWQSGQLIFEDEPLSAVIARVNRYGPQRIELADKSIASLEISGVFNAGDVDGFVSTLTHYLPVKSEHIGDAIYLHLLGEGNADVGSAP